MARPSSADQHTAVEIEIQINPDLASSVAKDRLRAAVMATLRREGVTGTITLVITDDDTIRGLNRDFLGKNTPTDVLAFGAQEEARGFVSAPEASGYLGDVVISYPRAASQAEDAGHSAEDEMDLLTIHGVLHLLGYDHADNIEKSIMWARQEEILQGLGSTPG